jgi:hypothetical protein
MFSEDRTSALEAGYFALYNVPALDDAYTALGYPAFVAAQVCARTCTHANRTCSAMSSICRAIHILPFQEDKTRCQL